MKKIIFLLLSLLFGSLFSSCNTTKRAEKRVYNIVEDHPELVRHDTVKIDTVFTIEKPSDSVIFAFDEVVENQTEVIYTNEGRFAITLLPSRKAKVVYTPDTVNLHYKKDIITEKIVIEEPRELWRDILLYTVLIYVATLLIKKLIDKILK